MDCYFLGGEQPNMVRMLLDGSAGSIGLSYSALVRRSGGKPRQKLEERFPDQHDLLLDSGGHMANSTKQQRSAAEWEAYAADYVGFVEANLDRCTYITEFDFLGLGPDWLEEMRRGVWKDVAKVGKFLPVWHPEQGIAALEITAERFGRVAVVGDVLAAPGQTASSQLRTLSRQGVEVVGLALTKTEVVENLPFHAVASSSWTSPMRYGDVIVFDGRTLHRYPKNYAEQGRKRHRQWVEQHGFDGEAWAEGDKNEALRVGIWSWLEWAKMLSARHGTPFAAGPDNSSEQQPSQGIATITALPVSRTPPRARELTPLPVFTYEQSETTNEDGETERELLPMVNATSMRQCNSCFLAQNGCPTYEADAACAWEMPSRVETKGQRRAVWNGAIGIQLQRVSLMYMNEQLSGGYADPNLSNEIDRLIKMMTAQAEVEDERDYFEMTVRARGGKQQGVMSRLFGNQVGEQAARLPRPYSEAETDRVLEGSFERP